MCGSVSNASYRIWIGVLPTFFNKRVSCHSGTNDPILVPYDSPVLDYEGELIAVIVKQAQSKSEGTITEVGLESVHVTRPKFCRGIGENLECRSGRSRPACIAVAHSRAEGWRRRESVHVEAFRHSRTSRWHVKSGRGPSSNADAISEYLTTHGLHGLASISATRFGRQFHIGKQDKAFRRATRR
ncbi:MAG: Fumarylacetoacetate hydrolase family [Mycobacterium sp.]|jgi:hypothetical protein|nr:Fumarylacetoacetate hydrolase family [Mycobacterium sp.]